ENLGKKYAIGHRSKNGNYVALRDVVTENVRKIWRTTKDILRGNPLIQGDTIEEVWALRDANLEIRQGEVIGIIGRNGSGKSTLLKILSRITEPSEGRVRLCGRVSSLLEVGTGFHPELTGRENIFLNGAILGMTREEIRLKFDEIVAFAEVEKFLDTPVKRYSSGMYVRLAFAVAAHLEPEILVVDEVLAVGDAEFQKKCLGKMSEVAGGGRTVLFVSHNMAAVETLCPRSIHLDTTVVEEGETDRVVASYLDHRLRLRRGERRETAIQDGLALESVRIAPSTIRHGDSPHLEFLFRAEKPGRIQEFAILIHSVKGIRVAIVDVRECGALPFKYGTGRFAVRTRIAAVPFVEGHYTLGLWLQTDGFTGTLFELEDFTVSSPRWSYDFAPYAVEHRGVVALQAQSAVVVDQQPAVAEAFVNVAGPCD